MEGIDKAAMIETWLKKHRLIYLGATKHPFILEIRDDSVDLSSFKPWLAQFNDVLLQENVSNYDMSHHLFDLTALQTIQIEKCFSVEFVQVDCWIVKIIGLLENPNLVRLKRFWGVYTV